jgi:LAGLIDADG-like domain
MNYKPWIKEEEDILKQVMSLGKYNYDHIAANYFEGRSSESLRRKAISLGMSNQCRSRKQYWHNENYFDIPNLRNSYHAGYAAADGCILLKRGASFNIQLSVSDVQYLELLKNDLEFTGKIFVHKRVEDGKERYMAQLRINSADHLTDSLKNIYGITPQKTYRISPPNLTDLYLKLAYFRGYIDGDGTVCFINENDGMVIRIASETYAILDWMKNLVDSLPIVGRREKAYEVNKTSNADCYYIAFAGIRAIKLFLILHALPTPYLVRKWDNPKMLDYVARYRSKHDDLFADVDKFMADIKLDGSSIPIISIAYIPPASPVSI